MKKFIFPLIFAVIGTAFGLSSCLDEGLSATFDLKFNTNSLTFKSTSINQGSFDEISEEISTDSKDFATYNTSLDKLESAKLKSLKITITAPSGQNFEFLKNVKVFLEGRGGSKGEQLVASKTITDGSATVVEMDVESDVNLVDHIKMGAFTLRAEGVTKTDLNVTDDIKCLLELSCDVTAKAI